jgi:hypothetical protein
MYFAIIKNAALLILTALFSACAHHTSKENSSPPVVAKPSIAPTYTFNPLSENSSPKLRKAWENFTASGRYRLAQAADFQVTQPRPYHFGFSNELLAIIIDSSATDEKRYLLAFFDPRESRDGSYKQYWVTHNHDLSRTKLTNASSILEAHEMTANGGYKMSHLKWDQKKQAFTCFGETISPKNS